MRAKMLRAIALPLLAVAGLAACAPLPRDAGYDPYYDDYDPYYRNPVTGVPAYRAPDGTVFASRAAYDAYMRRAYPRGVVYDTPGLTPAERRARREARRRAEEAERRRLERIERREDRRRAEEAERRRLERIERREDRRRAEEAERRRLERIERREGLRREAETEELERIRAERRARREELRRREEAAELERLRAERAARRDARRGVYGAEVPRRTQRRMERMDAAYPNFDHMDGAGRPMCDAGNGQMYECGTAPPGKAPGQAK